MRRSAVIGRWRLDTFDGATDVGPAGGGVGRAGGVGVGAVVIAPDHGAVKARVRWRRLAHKIADLRLVRHVTLLQNVANHLLAPAVACF